MNAPDWNPMRSISQSHPAHMVAIPAGLSLIVVVYDLSEDPSRIAVIQRGT